MIEKLFLAIGLVLAFEVPSMPFFRHFAFYCQTNRLCQ